MTTASFENPSIAHKIHDELPEVPNGTILGTLEGVEAHRFEKEGDRRRAVPPSPHGLGQSELSRVGPWGADAANGGEE